MNGADTVYPLTHLAPLFTVYLAYLPFVFCLHICALTLLCLCSASSVRGGRKRSFSSDSSEDDDSEDEVQQTQVGKKKPRKESTVTPLDTGLSLAEDEELVLHLLGSHS